MTGLLIALLAALGISIYDSGNKAQQRLDYHERTITNVKLQDELYIDNFRRVLWDLNKMDKETKPLVGDTLIEALEFLYQLYNIPDDRTPQERREDKEAYRKELAAARNRSRGRKYPQDDSQTLLPQRIWYDVYPKIYPHVKYPSLLFGTPKSTRQVGSFTYSYNLYGYAQYWNESCRQYGYRQTTPAKIIHYIVFRLTTKDLKAKGFNYSWNRKESDWQQDIEKIKKYDERHEKYPWWF